MKPTGRARVLFLFSDTGGGHRSAAEAIIEAIQLRYSESVEARMVDVFKEYAPRPLDRLPDLYPDLARHPQMWGLGYKLSDGPQASFLEIAFWPYVRGAMRRLVREQDAECVVSVHPLFNTAFLRAAGTHHPPFITVVTDLVTAHSLWYEPKVDLCIVPTKQAEQRALENNLPRGKVRVVGLPVAQRFCDPIGDPGSLRATLDWPQALPVVLLVGGGEGMGPLEETAEKISELDAEFALAIVTGRNTTLKRKLEARSWPIQTMVYGFERRMPEMMRAATLLVTKAGPGTITEALNAGLPMVLYSHLPGQETGNIDYVVEAGVGLWAPGPQRTAEAVRWWLWNQEVLQAAGEACLRMARPEAAMEIADIIAEQAHQPRAAQYSNSAGTHGRDESSA